MTTLYITNKNYSSWSLRPWVLLRELAIPFEERVVPLVEGSNKAQFEAFAPNARVPCLHDGSTIVWDSLAIVEYLAERHAGVWPSDPSARAWARCACAEMHAGFSALRTECSMSCGQRIALHRRSPELVADLQRIDALWNEGLARWGGPFLAGASYTAVDAFYAPVVFRAQTYDLSWTGAAQTYQAHALDRPSMEAWYRDALNEAAREAIHEDELRRSGECIQDLRVPPA